MACAVKFTAEMNRYKFSIIARRFPKRGALGQPRSEDHDPTKLTDKIIGCIREAFIGSSIKGLVLSRLRTCQAMDLEQHFRNPHTSPIGIEVFKKNSLLLLCGRSEPASLRCQE
jgi:hypothetical protein